MNEYSLIKEIGLPTTLIGLVGFALLLFFIYLVVKLVNPKTKIKGKFSETTHDPIIGSLEPKQRFILAIVVLLISASLIIFSIYSVSNIELNKYKKNIPNDTVLKRDTTNYADTLEKNKSKKHQFKQKETNSVIEVQLFEITAEYPQGVKNPDIFIDNEKISGGLISCTFNIKKGKHTIKIIKDNIEWTALFRETDTYISKSKFKKVGE